MFLGRLIRPLRPATALTSLPKAMAESTSAVASLANTPLGQPKPAAAIDFLMLLTRLKTTPRTGWVRKGVPQPESIADHMYRMGMMSLIATDSGVDAQKCIRIALVHDVAESIVGDITPHCPVTPEEKKRLESDAITTIQTMLGPETQAAQDVASLWYEYENASSPEALLVKDFDKLEMIIQAHEYEQAHQIDLDEFFKSTSGKFKTETGKAWAAELVSRRVQARKSAPSPE